MRLEPKNLRKQKNKKPQPPPKLHYDEENLSTSESEEKIEWESWLTPTKERKETATRVEITNPTGETTTREASTSQPTENTMRRSNRTKKKTEKYQALFT